MFTKITVKCSLKVLTKKKLYSKNKVDIKLKNTINNKQGGEKMKESYNELLKQLDIKKRIEELGNIRSKIYADSLTMSIQEKKEELSNLENKYNRLKQSFIQKIIKNKIIKDIEIKINDLKKEIYELEEKQKQNQKQLDELNKKIAELELTYKQEFDNLGDVIKIEDGIITINDSKKVDTINNQESKQVIVHATDYFPKNRTILCNFDGNKEEIYKPTSLENDLDHEVKYLSHRHTVHFVVNNIIGTPPDGAGNWEQSKFIIIEPLEPHKDRIITDINKHTDNFIYGSINLGEKPIILVREDAYNEIPEIEKDNYNIIKYNGNYEECMKNLLSVLGIKLKQTDNGDNIHHNSLEENVETSLNARNIAINYLNICDYNGKDEINVNEQQLFDIYEISPKIHQRSNNYSASNSITNQIIQESKEKEIDEEFIRFMISYGVEKTNNGYTFKSDDKLYYELKKISQIENEEEKQKCIKETYNFDEIKEVYDKYIINKKNKEQRIIDNLTKIIGEGHNITINKNGVEIKYYTDDRFFDMEKIESLGLNLIKDNNYNQTIIHQTIKAKTEEELYKRTQKLIDIINKTKKQNTIANEEHNTIKR